MLQTDFLSTAFRKNAEQLVSLATQIAKEEYRYKDLHTLRVCFKEMRAILTLLAMPDKKLPGKKLFKKAGVLREYRINRKLLNRYWISVPSRREWKSEVRELTRKGRKKLSVAARDLEAGQLKKMIRQVDEQCAKLSPVRLRILAGHFIDQEIRILQSLAGKNEFHLARRHLRNITLVSALLLANGLRVISARHWKQLKLQEEMLGEWHDREMLLTFTRSLTAGKPEGRSKKEWIHLAGTWQAENEASLKTLKVQLLHP